MKELFYIVIILVLLILVIHYYYQISKYYKIKSKIDNRYYYVNKNEDCYKSADLLGSLNNKIDKLKNYLKDEDDPLIKRLHTKYNPSCLRENINLSINTAYTVNKGEEIHLCLKNSDGTYIDENVIMFVLLHEITHVITIDEGHTDTFWKNMKFLIEKANECDIYTLIDFRKNPIKYCGIVIDNMPYDF